MKILVITIFSMLTYAVSAQEIRYGIRGGVGESTLPLKLTQNNQTATLTLLRAGFQLGLMSEYRPNEQFSIQPQLLLVTKGGETEASSQELSFKLTQVDLPVYFLYHHEGFFMGGGPLFSYGLSARTKIGNAATVDLYKDTSAGLSNIKFKRFEASAGALLGYEFPSGFLISVHYSRSFTNISTRPNIADVKNRMYGISIGYFFRPRKGATINK